MVIYNVTVAVDKAIEQEWVHWMKTEHMDEVVATGYFSEYRLFRILPQEDEYVVSYAVQYLAESIFAVNQYFQTNAPALRQKSQDKFGDKQVAFRTLLEAV